MRKHTITLLLLTLVCLAGISAKAQSTPPPDIWVYTNDATDVDYTVLVDAGVTAPDYLYYQVDGSLVSADTVWILVPIANIPYLGMWRLYARGPLAISVVSDLGSVRVKSRPASGDTPE